MYQYTIQCIIYLYIHEYLYALNAYPAHMYIIFPCQTTLTVHITGTHLPRTEHWLPKVHLMPRPILIKKHKFFAKSPPQKN